MRAWIWIVSLAAAGPAGCVWSHSPVPSGRPVREVYEGAPAESARALRLEHAPVPGAAERTRPVIYPPKIFAIWVPEHLDRERDFKIGAHFVYVKLRESSWVEEDIDREPVAAALADPSDLALLRGRLGSGTLGRMLVPYESQAQERAPDKGKARASAFEPARKGDER